MSAIAWGICIAIIGFVGNILTIVSCIYAIRVSQLQIEEMKKPKSERSTEKANVDSRNPFSTSIKYVAAGFSVTSMMLLAGIALISLDGIETKSSARDALANVNAMGAAFEELQGRIDSGGVQFEDAQSKDIVTTAISDIWEECRDAKATLEQSVTAPPVASSIPDSAEIVVQRLR